MRGLFLTLRFIIKKEVLLKLLMHVRCPFKNNSTVQFWKMILVYRKKRQQQKLKNVFLREKWSSQGIKWISGINRFMSRLARITAKLTKDVHGSQRNKLLLGFVWVKFALVEWLLFFLIMGADRFWHWLLACLDIFICHLSVILHLLSD